RNDGGDRAEDFFAGDAGGVLHVGKNGGLPIVAFADFLRGYATRGELGLFLSDLDVGVDAVILFFADERAHLGFAFERRTEFDFLGLFRHRFDEILVDRFLYQDAASGGADFALIDEDSEECAVDGSFEVGVGEEDVGRLAPQFERDALHRIGGLLDDDLADCGAAGKRDLVHVRVLDERSAGSFAEAGDDVDYASGQAAISKVFCKFEGGKRRLLGGFEDAGAACGDGRSKFPCGHEKRIVPWYDLSCDAYRFFERERHCVVRNRIDVADNFCGEAAVVFEASGSIGNVELGLDDGLAGVAALKFGERGKIGADFFRQTKEDAATLLCGCGGPGTFFECGFGGGNGAVDVVRAGVGDLGDHFLRRGIVDRERLRGFARDPLAVDVHLVGADFGGNSSGHLFDLLFTRGVKAPKSL